MPHLELTCPVVPSDLIPDGARKWKPDALSLVVELRVKTKLPKTVVK